MYVSSEKLINGLKGYAREFFGLLMLCSVMFMSDAQAERLKDITSIQGVRSNQLIGYGLVVGLDGTGDQTAAKPLHRCQVSSA